VPLGNRVLPIKTPLKYFPDSKVHFNLLGHLTAQKWVHEDREYLYNKRAARYDVFSVHFLVVPNRTSILKYLSL